RQRRRPITAASQQLEIPRLDRRKDALQGVLIEAEHALEQTAEKRAVIGQHRKIAVLEEVRLVDRHLLACDAAASDAAAQHPIDAAMAVIGAAIAVLAERAAEFRNDDHER